MIIHCFGMFWGFIIPSISNHQATRVLNLVHSFRVELTESFRRKNFNTPGGHPEGRSATTLNCPAGVAWWRHYLCTCRRKKNAQLSSGDWSERSEIQNSDSERRGSESSNAHCRKTSEKTTCFKKCLVAVGAVRHPGSRDRPLHFRRLPVNKDRERATGQRWLIGRNFPQTQIGWLAH